MNFIAFQKVFRESGVIELNEIQKEFPRFHARRLTDWQEKGYIQKVINRFYCWTDQPLTEQAVMYAANRIYRDSYISLWSALSHYQLIPEGVYQTYSVSTHKTRSFTTPIGELIYKHIRPALFFGYRIERWEDKPLLIAEPEKALLDTIYLNPQWRDPADIEALRLNWPILADVAQSDILQEYAGQYSNQRVAFLAAHISHRMTHD